MAVATTAVVPVKPIHKLTICSVTARSLLRRPNTLNRLMKIEADARRVTGDPLNKKPYEEDKAGYATDILETMLENMPDCSVFLTYMSAGGNPYIDAKVSDDHIVGWLMLHGTMPPTDIGMYICACYVLPAYQQQSIGTRMMKHAIDRYKVMQKKYKDLVLDVADHKAYIVACAFYKKLGFVKDKLMQPITRDPYPSWRLVYRPKPLLPAVDMKAQDKPTESVQGVDMITRDGRLITWDAPVSLSETDRLGLIHHINGLDFSQKDPKATYTMIIGVSNDVNVNVKMGPGYGAVSGIKPVSGMAAN